MYCSDFDFDLPQALIAQAPPAQRRASRMLVLSRADGDLSDSGVDALGDYLRPGDLLVLNDTKVLRARLFGHKASGGRVEILLERVLDDARALAQLRVSKAPKPGSLIHVDDVRLQVAGRQGTFYEVVCLDGDFDHLMARHGHVPLPPYVQRPDQADDELRYQTVYARVPGAVAAPTAGLHFDQALLASLRDKGVTTAFVTLHVGAGTFQPVRVERPQAHRMHRERVIVSESLCRQWADTRRQGGRVIAVGTTSVRSLETAWHEGVLRPFDGETELFLYPGQPLHTIDGLLTNFHLPQSTLLMLVCAFAGTERVLAAYRHAVNQAYRFFSYGDAMLIL